MTKAPEAASGHGLGGRPLLAALALLLATGCGFLLLRGRRPVIARMRDGIATRVLRLPEPSASAGLGGRYQGV